MTPTKVAFISTLVAIVAFGPIIGAIASRSTFGQRCAAVYPDPLQQEKCIWRLDHSMPIVNDPFRP